MPSPVSATAQPGLLWDIFCAVVDNYGDIGVCWRLACNLAQRGQRVRLWVDDARPLQWLAPHGHKGVQVRHWRSPLAQAGLPTEPADVLVEAFGCTLDDAVQAQWAQQQEAGRNRLWLNLEYLTAERYAADWHLLPSPVMHGPAAGLHKQFFYPGFVAGAGGLLREPGLVERQRSHPRASTLQALGASTDPACLSVSLFCYEPPALPALLQQLAQRPSQLLVTQGRARVAVQGALGDALEQSPKSSASHAMAAMGACRLMALPWLTQTAFDDLLWSCDLNFVRGEDSLVRALWAGQPFVWQIYPQHDNAHHAKLDAFLDWLQAPPDLREWHALWNGVCSGALPPLTRQRLQAWQGCVQAARARLLQQDDLCSQLLALVQRRTAIACVNKVSG